MQTSEDNVVKSEVYSFGQYTLDADRRELRGAGKVVTTQPKVFELLLYLIRHRSRAIDKDELQDAIWPRMIVTETALTRAVMKARRAVGDDADRQSVIRTVHGHGYRFVAELDAAPAPAAEATATPRSGAGPTGWRRSRLFTAGAAALVAAAVAWWYFATPAYSGPVRLAVLPVENATGNTELDWASTGLMALMNRMLEDGGVNVVGGRNVTELAAGRSLEELVAADSEFRATLEKTTAATHLLAARLESEDGLYRLSYQVSDRTGRPQRRTVIGTEPAGLAKEVVDTITALMTRGAPVLHQVNVVSGDVFLNETYARAMSLEFEGRYEEAQRMFQVIIDQEPESFWPRYEFALCARNLRDFDRAERLLVGLESADSTVDDPARLSAVKNALGILYMNRNRDDEARARLEDVVRLAARTGNAEHAAAAQQNLGLLARNSGDVSAAYEHMTQSLELYRSMDIATLPGTLQNNLSGVLVDLGDLDQAEQYARGAIDYFRLTGQRLYESYALSRLSTIFRLLGALDDAEQTQLRARAIREELGDRAGVAGSLVNLAAIAYARGDLTRSLQYAQQAHDIATEIDEPSVTIGALQRIAKAELALGQPQKAIANYTAAEAVSRTIGDRGNEHASRYGVARARIRVGDYDGADAIADELLQTARQGDLERQEAGALALQAEVLMARQRWADAAGLLESAIGIAERIGDTALADAAHAHLAEALLELDEPETARTHLGAVTQERATDADLVTLRARLAARDGDAAEAARLMGLARSYAGEAWSREDEVLLESYRRSAEAVPAAAE